MHPVWIAGAVILALYLVIRRREHGRGFLALGALAAVGAGLIGFGVVELPNVEKLIEDAGQALGKWTYLVVGVLAFLETGAFIGLVAPGETTVIVGGLVAGQGEISLMLLIAIVWTCAVLGDVTSYALGRRLGRDFMVRHGGRVKITEERMEQVEAFFERRGGMTILIGRFIGLVRAIAPFIAGASRMPLRKFLPYDVLGAGLWATTFCVLGYVFWRSFDQLTAWVSRGLFAFSLFVALIVAIVFLVRLQRSPELRERTGEWIAAQLEKPLLRPVAPYLRAAWRARRCSRWRGCRSGRRASSGTASRRATWASRCTTLLALAAVGSFSFFLLGDAPEARGQVRLDDFAFDIADRLYSERLKDVAVWVTRARLAAGRRHARRVDRALGGLAPPLRRCRRAGDRVPADVGGRRHREGGLRPAAPARRACRDRGHVVSRRATRHLRSRGSPARVVLVRGGSGFAARFAVRDRRGRADGGDRADPRVPARPLSLRRQRRRGPRDDDLRARGHRRGGRRPPASE